MTALRAGARPRWPTDRRSGLASRRCERRPGTPCARRRRTSSPGWRSVGGSTAARRPGGDPPRRRPGLSTPTAWPTRAGPPLTPRHRFRIASHSKTFTATAIMQLVERGPPAARRSRRALAAELAGTPSRGVPSASCWPTAAASSATARTATSGSCARAFPDRRRCRHRHRRRRGARPQRAVQVLQHRLLAARSASSRPSPASRTPSTSPDVILGPLGLDDTSPDLDPGRGRRARHRLHRPGYADRPPAHRPRRHRRHGLGHRVLVHGDRSRPLRGGPLARRRPACSSDDAKRQMQRAEWAVEGATSCTGSGWPSPRSATRRVVGHGGGFPGFITRTWWDPVDRLALAVLTNAIDGPALTLANAPSASSTSPGRPARRRRRRRWHRGRRRPDVVLRALRQPVGRHRRRRPRRPPVPARSDRRRTGRGAVRA